MALGLVVAAGFTDKILALPAWLVLALVFLLPALEASAFVGFVFPGEVAVILGGVAAARGIVPLWAVIVAAVSGAVIGDSAGYLIGRRWGDRLLEGTIGRLPVIGRRLDKHLESARAYVRRRRGSGMAVLGYLAGASYKHVEKIAGRAGLGLLALIVASLAVSRLLRRLAARPRLRAFGEGLAATPPLAWIRRRFPGQVAWGRRRLAAGDPRGFWLTFTVAAGALAGWAFGAITQDVVAPDELALRDPHVAAWVADHRTGWLTAAAKAAAWPGSGAVIVSLAVLAAAVLAARRDWRSVIRLALALGGSVALYSIVQPLVGRSRPPITLWIGQYGGPAFPSGPATRAIACYSMLAIILAARRSARGQALLWIGAAVLTIVAGVSGIYLGANWLTDVLAGWALGALWVTLVLTADLLITRRGGRPAAAPRPRARQRLARLRGSRPGTDAVMSWMGAAGSRRLSGAGRSPAPYATASRDCAWRRAR